MSHAVCVRQFDQGTLENATLTIEEALSKAALRRHSDYVSRIWVFCTEHFSDHMPLIAQIAISKSHCMNVWGGCVSGLLQNNKVQGHEPMILVAVFGREFEPPQKASTSTQTIRFSLAENDAELDYVLPNTHMEATEASPRTTTMGLLSYGANYAKMPRIDHGRLSQHPESSQQLWIQNPLILNSEGLTFLCDTQMVTESNGLFLMQVKHQPAQQALNAPNEQTRPIGLRLHVIHDQGDSWIPVMEVHADGTLGLAAPVLKGQLVRLAKRSPDAIKHDIQQWKLAIHTHFGEKPPQLGVLFAGFERSQLCHEQEDDITAVINAFPNTEWIGLFGQAAWLAAEKTLIAPPRNNRLSICLFNPDHV